jgi:hypothetical protein
MLDARRACSCVVHRGLRVCVNGLDCIVVVTCVRVKACTRKRDRRTRQLGLLRDLARRSAAGPVSAPRGSTTLCSVQRHFILLLCRLRRFCRFLDCLVSRFGHLRCGFRCGAQVTLRDIDCLLRSFLHVFVGGVGERKTLVQKCDCGFGAGRGVLRDILDEPLNLAVDLLVLGVDNLCQLRLYGRRNLGDLTSVRQDLLRRGQRQRVLPASNF